jgi:hypothetical protein
VSDGIPGRQTGKQSCSKADAVEELPNGKGEVQENSRSTQEQALDHAAVHAGHAASLLQPLQQ